MNRTIIDSDNYAASGIETLFFPGGEPHAKVPHIDSDVLLHLKLRTWNDVGIGLCVADAIRRQIGSDRMILFIPYFPGARQDRSDGTAPITVAIIANSFSHYHGYVFDVHSLAFWDYTSMFAELAPYCLKIVLPENIDGIIIPDIGAQHRAIQFRNKFCNTAVFLQCEKERDSATGRLSNYRMPELPVPGQYLVVDDICDGGGTFNLLAQAFEADPLAKYSSLELFISHGIFSKGLDAIHPRYKRITTTDSWCRLPNTNRLTVIPLLPTLLEIISA